MKVAGISVDPAPLTYEAYWCMMCAHGCECIALSPEQWAALPKAGTQQ